MVDEVVTGEIAGADPLGVEIPALPDEVPEGEPEKGGDFVDVEYEGATYSVPPPLKDALLRQQDYTQKTTTLADDRRNLQSERTAVQERITSLNLQAAMQQEIGRDQALMLALDARADELDGMDWSKVIQESPQQALLYQQQRQLLANARNQTEARIQQAQAQFMAAYDASIQQAALAGEAQLTRDIQNWRDPEYRSKLANYGVSMGFTPQDMQLVYRPVDPRYMRVLHKAYLYDEMRKSGDKKQLPKPITVLKGGGIDSGGSDTKLSDDAWFDKEEKVLKSKRRA